MGFGRTLKGGDRKSGQHKKKAPQQRRRRDGGRAAEPATPAATDAAQGKAWHDAKKQKGACSVCAGILAPANHLLCCARSRRREEGLARQDGRKSKELEAWREAPVERAAEKAVTSGFCTFCT